MCESLYKMPKVRDSKGKFHCFVKNLMDLLNSRIGWTISLLILSLLAINISILPIQFDSKIRDKIYQFICVTANLTAIFKMTRDGVAFSIVIAAPALLLYNLILHNIHCCFSLKGMKYLSYGSRNRILRPPESCKRPICDRERGLSYSCVKGLERNKSCVLVRQ